MPIYDGVEVLEKLQNKEKYIDSCIVISGEIENIQELRKNNIIHTVIDKSTDMKTIITKINNIIEDKLIEDNINKKVINEILFLGYNFSHKGTKYLIKTIEFLAMHKFDELDNLEKAIYPIIAKYYNESVHNVKCNINRATTSMYYECEIEKLKKYFCLNTDKKPKIKTIINTIINKIV